ncbi:hypothetical protein HK096_010414, partial [Nowakowskiella sp. JEL0078]
SAPGYTTIKTSSLQPLIWSFNPTPTKNINGEWLSYHGVDRRGYLRATSLSAGAIVSAEPVNYVQKQAHGAGMAAIWLLIFPSAVLWSRYLRSVPNWLFIHMGIQTIGASGVLALVSVIAITVNGFDGTRPHSVFGIILVVFLVLQVTLGVMNLLGLVRDAFRTVREITRYVHAGLGMFLLIASIVQVGLGLDLVYPFSFKEDRGIEAWLFYFVLSAFWVAIFVFLEVFFRLKIHGSRKKNVAKPVYNVSSKQSMDSYAMTLTNKKVDGGGGEEYQGYLVVKNSSVNSRNVYNPVMPFPEASPRTVEALRQFTWDSLDKEILKGKLYVVGNGKYVYDISRWIVSHPGGQSILFSVSGTDITNDYWNDDSFDKEFFIPAEMPLIQSESRIPASTIRSQFTASMISDSSS